jgi:3'-phosphoadenosine 5'-phosphosulfate sulfotransferase (PAPS reductase)/FAD synthetase
VLHADAAGRRVSARKPADFIRYRLPSFQRKLAAAENLIRDCLEVSRPYVAFSGGKDSLAALAITAMVSKERPIAIWGDDELELPEQIPYVPSTCRALGVDLTIVLSIATHAEWFTAWAHPPHWREPLPGAIPLDARIKPWTMSRGYTGAILGLRKDERAKRRIYLNAKGSLYQNKAGQWQCNPLANWTVDEVWALIAGWRLPYNPAYDRLAEIGVEREAQRVGPLPLAVGWHLRAGWPEMWRRLNERYGNRWPG